MAGIKGQKSGGHSTKGVAGRKAKGYIKKQYSLPPDVAEWLDVHGKSEKVIELVKEKMDKEK
ncbi:hypothetical protein [Fusobacterium ulcerans]|uniref:hypothetical protein n=1 Tax=Fusobacterium ulcerans TaxID=861 RepID=UPI0026DCFB84|nr:hypothetical protein [Fusobacterium ulcerans]